MPRRMFNDGQEITDGDLKKVSSSLEIELYERLIRELMGRQSEVCFADSFKVIFTNSTTVSVTAGNGVQYDATQVDPESKYRLLYLSTAASRALTTAHASLNRIDIVSIRANRATILSETRNFKPADGSAVTTSSMVVQTDWASDTLVTAGTPGASPAVPSTPAGYIKLAELLVTAVTGVASQAAITDKRLRFKPGSNYRLVSTVTTAYTIDRDDNTILANAAGGAFSVTLPLAADVANQEFTVKNIGASNAVTVAPAGADVIDGEVSQILDARYSSITVRSNGSGWYLV